MIERQGSDVAVHKRDVERSEGEGSPGQETTVVEEGDGEQEGAPSTCTGTCVAPPVSTCTSVVPSMEPATWDDSVESEALAVCACCLPQRNDMILVTDRQRGERCHCWRGANGCDRFLRCEWDLDCLECWVLTLLVGEGPQH